MINIFLVYFPKMFSFSKMSHKSNLLNIIYLLMRMREKGSSSINIAFMSYLKIFRYLDILILCVRIATRRTGNLTKIFLQYIMDKIIFNKWWVIYTILDSIKKLFWILFLINSHNKISIQHKIFHKHFRIFVEYSNTHKIF